MNNNKVSIIIPCYNQAHFLNEAVASIMKQTYDNWECIIVNDGSTDETENIAQSLVEGDERIRYHKKENGGLSSARNAGLNLSTGSFIQFLDADDYLEKTKLEKSFREIAKNPEIKIVVSNFKMFQNDILKLQNPYCKISQQELTFQTLLNHWDDYFTIPIHCGFFDKSLFQDFRFPEHIKAKEDWVMWITIFKDSPEAIFIDEYLAYYRKNEQSMTMTRDMSLDYLNAITYFKQILSKDDYEIFLSSTIKNKFKESNIYKLKLTTAINSKSYIVGKTIKKSLRKIYLLKLATTIINLLFYRILKK